MKKAIAVLLSSMVSLSACVAAPVRSEGREGAFGALPQIQFFKGRIQRSSLDGSQNYGPSFESVVRRAVDHSQGKILECIFQEGKVFVTEMSRTGNPLVYAVNDLGGYSSGSLIMETDAAQAWSYHVDVLKPMTGKITGSLSDGNGARIFPDGHMEIRKIWNNQMLISEKYAPISEDEYLRNLPAKASISVADIVAEKCQ